MVHHIVLWNFNEDLKEPDRKKAAELIREKLEEVKKQADGVISLKVVTEGLASGNRDIALISEFESEEALKAYQVHPAHVKAGAYIRTVTCNRAGFDY